MMVDSLVFRNADPEVVGFLPSAEVLNRVTKRFPLAVVDQEMADDIVKSEAEQLAGMLSPTDPLVALHRGLIGRVSYVTIQEIVDGPELGFLVYPEPTVLDIDYEGDSERDECRPLLKALLTELPEYDLETEDVYDEEDEEE